ncbi:MAG: AI-2E family transporter [Firmicutes bacterium]|nr:AI-2E family transporter [Bacillota bacterium]
MLPPVLTAAALFCAALILLKLAFPYVAPFLLGLSLALFLDGPVTYLEQRGWPRPATSLALVTACFLALPGVIGLFFVRLWQEMQGLLTLGLVGQLAGEFSEHVLSLLEKIPFASQWDFAGLFALPQVLLSWASAIPDLFLIWTLTALSAYFFLRDKRKLFRWAAEQLPQKRAISVRQLYVDTVGALWHLVRVQLVLVLLSTGASMVFFSLLKLPFPLLSGFLVGFFDLCPVVGPGLVYLALALIQLSLGNSQIALALGLGYLVVLLLRQWGEPHLVGERLGLHPLAALIGVYVGFRIWGPLGAVTGPILLVIFQAYLRQTRAHVCRKG